MITPRVAQMDRINSRPRWVDHLAVIVVFTGYYFSDVYIRASEKYFWFDELITVYLCRLTFRHIWEALRHGADFNPPLFYFLTKTAETLFGEGLVTTRLPSIVGFWCFCICLYLVVSKRAGPLAGA